MVSEPSGLWGLIAMGAIVTPVIARYLLADRGLISGQVLTGYKVSVTGGGALTSWPAIRR
jgi:hypothetical protein